MQLDCGIWQLMHAWSRWHTCPVHVDFMRHHICACTPWGHCPSSTAHAHYVHDLSWKRIRRAFTQWYALIREADKCLRSEDACSHRKALWFMLQAVKYLLVGDKHLHSCALVHAAVSDPCSSPLLRLYLLQIPVFQPCILHTNRLPLHHSPVKMFDTAMHTRAYMQASSI